MLRDGFKVRALARKSSPRKNFEGLDVEIVEGDMRDAAAMRVGIERGRQLLAWQSYEVRDHVVSGETVVTRMRWTGELAIDAGPWPAGTQKTAWCVADYRLAGGRIIEIEQHDCYEQP